MKLLVITQYYYPEMSRMNELSYEIAKRGHKVKVLTSYPSYPINRIYDGYGYDIPYERGHNDVEIERLKSSPRGKTPIGLLNNCYSFVRLGKEWVKKCEEFYDNVLVICQSPTSVGLVAKYYKEKFPKANILMNVQDLWPENVEEVLGVKFAPLSMFIIKMMDDIYKSSDYVLCSSQSFVEHLNTLRNVTLTKLKFWPQPYLEQDTYEMPLEYDSLDDDIIKIVYTGNIGYAQGLDLLIETAHKYKNEKLKWFLVGDGRAKLSLIDLVNKYNINDKVVFVGKKDIKEANDYSHFADLSYLSFKNEIFNMTIPAKLQGYLACKSPILCVAGGESAKIVNDNRCGFVADKNPESIYKKIIEYKNMLTQEKNKLKENAYKCYKENFTMDKLIDELEKYME